PHEPNTAREENTPNHLSCQDGRDQSKKGAFFGLARQARNDRKKRDSLRRGPGRHAPLQVFARAGGGLLFAAMRGDKVA
ncbi:MAG TPA: hypothetical protein PKO23_11880, partial [Candidatus Hydrogenedentes bacterium]|nr:hypothetical protein [Candidatus Hydrogenedentota bacterium]